jgi:ABC-type Mn2+/Zn2+ transport system ATPase subunit
MLNGVDKNRVAVDNLSFGIEQGEVFELLDVNGAGRSWLTRSSPHPERRTSRVSKSASWGGERSSTEIGGYATMPISYQILDTSETTKRQLVRRAEMETHEGFKGREGGCLEWSSMLFKQCDGCQ